MRHAAAKCAGGICAARQTQITLRNRTLSPNPERSFSAAQMGLAVENVAHSSRVYAVVVSNFVTGLTAPMPKPNVDSLVIRELGSSLQRPYFLATAYYCEDEYQTRRDYRNTYRRAAQERLSEYVTQLSAYPRRRLHRGHHGHDTLTGRNSAVCDASEHVGHVEPAGNHRKLLVCEFANFACLSRVHVNLPLGRGGRVALTSGFLSASFVGAGIAPGSDFFTRCNVPTHFRWGQITMHRRSTAHDF
jgi:hypothetical protein